MIVLWTPGHPWSPSKFPLTTTDSPGSQAKLCNLHACLAKLTRLHLLNPFLPGCAYILQGTSNAAVILAPDVQCCQTCQRLFALKGGNRRPREHE